MSYQILRIHKDDPRSWGLMPWLFARIYKFSDTHDSTWTPNEMCTLVQNAFVWNSPFLGLWAAVNDDGMIGGHLLATAEPWGQDQLRYVLIRQAEVDRRLDVGDCVHQAFGLCETWAQSLGLNKIMMVTHRNPKAFRRAWGFTQTKVVMEKNLDAPMV